MKLDAIGIVVKNMDEALRFYRLLGLEFPAAGDGEDHVEAVATGGLRLMLDKEELVKGFTPDWVPPQGQRMGLAFLCASPADVDAAHSRITAAGFRSAKEPWDAFWGQRYAQVMDPDGSRVDLFAPLPTQP
jgi:catechol 2,3-dioxygenase-like lactoylglutathione lyase family enzyme